jgi:hypothetical protein
MKSDVIVTDATNRIIKDLCRITIDEIEYICEMHEETSEGINGVTAIYYCFGDLSEQYPFKFKSWERNMWGTIDYPIATNFLDGGEHFIKIEEVVNNSVYYTLDEQFIPSSIARQEYVDSTFALKSDIKDVDLSGYETKDDAQAKYDELKSIKSDWNQNDSSSSKYIENRTHWIDSSFGLLLDECETTENDGKLPLNTPFVDTTYKITLNGISYICKPHYNWDEDFSIGNSRLEPCPDDDGNSIPDMTNPIDVPFLITVYDNSHLLDGGGDGNIDVGSLPPYLYDW